VAQDDQRLCEIRASASRAAYPNYFDAAMIISAPRAFVAMSENYEGKPSLEVWMASIHWLEQKRGGEEMRLKGGRQTKLLK
jgi:hypothetical protein